MAVTSLAGTPHIANAATGGTPVQQGAQINTTSATNSVQYVTPPSGGLPHNGPLLPPPPGGAGSAAPIPNH